MLKFFLGMLALLGISAALSRPELRAEAREKFRPTARLFWIATAVMVAFLVVPWWRLL